MQSSLLKPSTEQIGFLVATVQKEYSILLPDKVDNRGANMKYSNFEQWIEQTLDMYETSAFINILRDEKLTIDFRRKFFTDYLIQKKYSNFEAPTNIN